MAWRVVECQNVPFCGATNITLLTSNTQSETIYNSSSAPSGVDFNKFFDNHTYNSGYTNYILGNSTLGVRLIYNDNDGLRLEFVKNGSYIDYLWFGYKVNYDYQYVDGSIIFIIDDTTQKGRVLVYRRPDLAHGSATNQYIIQSLNKDTNNKWQDLYTLITGAIVIPYNWQSVPSISGKNGILSLVTLDSESINDGEPVSGAAVSVFDQPPSNDNNIKNLADTYGGEEESSAVDVTVKYKVTLPPGGSFSALKIVAKKDSAPEDASDGDNIVDISPTKTKKTISDLDENSLYYFKIFGEDTNGNTSESDEKHINTSEEEGVPFDYTGSIQEFTVPETGMYSLETWGAQGQNAGNNRGGYGAYAYAEAFLTEGQKLYIGIGGQNGYNGGGNYTSGSIRNIAIPDFNQSIIMDYSLWTNDWDSDRVAVGSIPKKFTIGYDFLNLVMNATLGTESVLIFERNGVKIYAMRDNRNATYGGYYNYSVYVKDGDEIVAGSQYPDTYYSRAWYIANGFDKREDMYNSNVWKRIQAFYLGFGVDDDARLGYLVGCTKWHNGYYQGLYINNDSFTSKKITNNTSQYGEYCNQAKLYEALKKMAGE